MRSSGVRSAAAVRVRPNPLSDRSSPLKAAYLEKRRDLVRFFSLRLRSAEAGEDLVQDMFVKISGLPDSQIDNPIAYLYRLGWNMMLDRLRQQRRATVREGDWSNAQHTVVANDAVAEGPSAEDILDGRQRLQRIIDALKDLPPQTQRVFRMHKFEGLSHGEVAARMGVSRSAVEKHVSAALRHLIKVK
jgi:RNA polymerase sigma-70 factor (ECF subfamily)